MGTGAAATAAAEQPALDPNPAAPVVATPEAGPESTVVVVEEVPAPPPADPLLAAHDEQGHEDDHEDDHGGPVLLVNDQPFHGQADPKLDGCAVTLSVSELAEGPHTVVGAVVAGEPSGTGPLVSFDESFEGASWTQTWALDDLVGELVKKPNGYRIRVVVTVDGGTTKTSRPFWLACGAPQSGNPYVIVLDKQWLGSDGEILDGPPAKLPEAWALRATSQLGSATCTYPDGSQELVCTYENKGAHQGATDGLYVPGGKGKTFTVAESDLPDGWNNVSGLGTFEPRVLCPRGGGHDDDDHEHEAARAGEDDEDHGGVCEHVVVNRQEAPPEVEPTSPTAPTTPQGIEVAPASLERTPGADEATLARTGTTSAPLAAAGAASVALGMAVLVLRRHRFARSR
jgi:hypothetical protein